MQEKKESKTQGRGKERKGKKKNKEKMLENSIHKPMGVIKVKSKVI